MRASTIFVMGNEGLGLCINVCCVCNCLIEIFCLVFFVVGVDFLNVFVVVGIFIYCFVVARRSRA